MRIEQSPKVDAATAATGARLRRGADGGDRTATRSETGDDVIAADVHAGAHDGAFVGHVRGRPASEQGKTARGVWQRASQLIDQPPAQHRAAAGNQ